jgi:hypothetical protein
MGTVTRTYTYSAGAVIVAAQHNSNENALFNLVNGNLDTNNLSASAAIVDTQLAQITTASKVSTGALTTTSAAAGDVLYHNGTIWTRLAKDAGKYLKSGASAVSWDTPATTMPAGTVVQVVNTQTGAYATTSTQLDFDDSIPQNDEGAEFMTLAITPTSATNSLKIEVVFNCRTASDATVVALFQDTTAGALAAAYSGGAYDERTCITFTHYMTAGTTSATTFKVRGGPGSAGNLYFNGSAGARVLGGVCASSITITEVKV